MSARFLPPPVLKSEVDLGSASTIDEYFGAGEKDDDEGEEEEYDGARCSDDPAVPLLDRDEAPRSPLRFTGILRLSLPRLAFCAWWFMFLARCDMEVYVRS